VKADSALKSIADATPANTVAYSSNGASTHSVVLGLIKELGLKAKPIATGGPAATITLLMSGQVDIGWSSPPLAFDLLDEGKIRIFARANDVPSLRGQTVRVNIANADSLKTRRDAHVRFTYAKRLRDEFFAKSALDADTVKGGRPADGRGGELQISAGAADPGGAIRAGAGAAEIAALTCRGRVPTSQQQLSLALDLGRPNDRAVFFGFIGHELAELGK
jgi:hypothetical protein